VYPVVTRRYFSAVMADLRIPYVEGSADQRWWRNSGKARIDASTKAEPVCKPAVNQFISNHTAALNFEADDELESDIRGVLLSPFRARYCSLCWPR
jgi:hypothetical protein